MASPPHRELRRPPAPSYVHLAVVFLVALAAASAYLTRSSLAAAATLIQADFRISSTTMGFVFSAFNLGYLIGQVPMGWLGQRFGTRGAFAASSIVWSLLTLAVALARSVAALATLRFLFGIAQAGLAPLAGQVLKEWVPERNRGLASSLVAASMSIGAAVTISATGWLLDDGLRWQTVFAAYSAVGIVWAVVYFAVARNRPEEHPWVSDAELTLIRGDVPEPVEAGEAAGDVALHDGNESTHAAAGFETSLAPRSEPRPARSLGMRMLTSRSVWALCAQSFFRAAGYEFFVTWMFAYLELSHGVQKSEAGWMTMLPLIGAAGGSLLGGVVVDAVRQRTEGRWWSRSAVAAGSLFLAALLMAGAAASVTPLGQAAIIGLGAILMGASAPAIWAATMDIGGRQTGVTLGVMNMAGCLAGVVVPPAIGTLIAFLQNSAQPYWNLVIYVHVAFNVAGGFACLLMRPDECLTDEE